MRDLNLLKYALWKSFWEIDVMHKDEIVEETRRLRDEYSKKFNYDLDSIYEDLKQKEAESGRTYVSFADKKSPTMKAPANKTRDSKKAA